MRLVVRGLLLALTMAGAAQALAESASVLYEKALVSFGEGKFREAKIFTKNALMQEPSLLSARILLGRIYTREGDGRAAGKEFVTAERLGASPEALVVPRAEALVVEKRYKEVVEQIFPSYSAAGINGEILLIRGLAFLELDELSKAAAAYEQAATFLPGRADPLVGKGQVLLRDGQVAEAETEAVVALKLEPQSVSAWSLKGSIAHLRGDLQTALHDYEKALRLDFTRVDVQIAYIGVLIDLKRFSEADAAAVQIHDLVPYDPRITYLMAVARTGQGDHQGAEVVIRKTGELLSRLPPSVMESHGPSIMLAALVNYSLHQWEQARTHLERYLQLQPDQVGPRKLLATILLAQGEAQKALSTLEVVAEAGRNDYRFLTLLGEAYSKTGAYQRAAEVLDRALAINPDGGKARTWRALNNITLGSGLEAAEDLALAFREQPKDSKLGIALYLLRMQQGKYAQAVAVAQQLVKEASKNPTYRNLLASAQFAAGDRASAQDNFELTLLYAPDFLPARINLAKLERLDGKPREAEKRLLSLQKAKPDNVTIMLELARTLAVQGRAGDAIRWLEKARAIEPSNLTTLNLLTDLLIARHDLDRAIEVVDAAQGVAPNDLRVLKALGTTRQLRGDREGAGAAYRRMATVAERDADMLVDIAGLQQQVGDVDGAIRTLNMAVTASGAALRPRVLLAQQLTENGQYDKATAIAEGIRSDFPGEVAGLRMLADLAVLRGDLQTALARYREGLAAAQEPALAIGLAHVYRLSGEPDRATGLLRDWLERHPQQVAVRQALAESYLLGGSWEKAGAQYEQLVQGGSKDPMVWNNLAMISDHLGRPGALGHARKAHVLDPESPAVNDTLGWLMVKRGEAAEGLKYLRNAQARAPDSLETRFHIAVALHRVGFNKQARDELEELLPKAGDAYWVAEAQQLLTELSR